jgi:hypothetical protein
MSCERIQRICENGRLHVHTHTIMIDDIATHRKNILHVCPAMKNKMILTPLFLYSVDTYIYIYIYIYIMHMANGTSPPFRLLSAAFPCSTVTQTLNIVALYPDRLVFTMTSQHSWVFPHQPRLEVGIIG